MNARTPLGWQRLTIDPGSPRRFPIAAYSEFMPPPRLGRKPYGETDDDRFSRDEPYGWRVSEWEEEVELRPGLEALAAEILHAIARLTRGEPSHQMSGPGGRNLQGNPFWPDELATAAGKLAHERCVMLLPLALARTQDDKGRVRWTVFGGSEQGPERALWQSFQTEPGREVAGDAPVEWVCRLLGAAYGEQARGIADLLARGFRVLQSRADRRFPWTPTEPPAWTRPLTVSDDLSPAGIRYLLTFRPFADLPAAVRSAYLAGRLHLLPCPASLVFWGMPTYLHLQRSLPLAMQIPVLRTLSRRHLPNGLRVPQSGWIHERRSAENEAAIEEALLAPAYRRTSRWDRIHRHDEELASIAREDRVARVLFSTELDVMGLYDKPMARNAQLWDARHELVLDGPAADPAGLERAERRLAEGGVFGYRFHFPAMRVGEYEVYWQRPLVAFPNAATGEPVVLHDGPRGYFTAYRNAAVDLADPVELWPRLLGRPAHLAAIRGFAHHHDHYAWQTTLNILALLDAGERLGGQPLPREFARRLLRIPREETLEAWLDALPSRASEPGTGELVRDELRRHLARAAGSPAASLTFESTATRAFESGWWRDIATLAHGRWRNKDNADCVLDPITQGHLAYHHRDLEALGDYLLGRHREAIAAAGMLGQASCGSLPFGWRTDFDFTLFGGWRKNQEGQAAERDLLVVIPGRRRAEAVILADHYDTAYMEDVFDTSSGGSGARLAAHGADDNHSATATLLQAAPIFLRLAQQGKLERDVWLLHLTGEEFPSDCMGARHLCQALVEGTLVLHEEDGRRRDLSATRVVGVFVMDMIAHNRESGRDIFQIAPGEGRAAMRLALHAHLANAAWDAMAPAWNRSADRHDRPRSRRVADPDTVPATAPHPLLAGEVRLQLDPHSSLYNTDGQIFSDVGVPAVLLMENYDIHRSGYHDTKDTMANIDLDYGSALAAIAIETVARVAAATEV
ncbi:MAG: M28 family peptidase [Acidobacteriota bacterium]